MPLLVELTDDALHDLEEIWHYIDRYDGPDRADYVLARLEEAFGSLSAHAHRGSYPDELLEIGIR